MGNHNCITRSVKSLTEDNELIATKAGNGVPGAHNLAQSTSDLLQDKVPLGMTECVVELFKMVDVNKEQR